MDCRAERERGQVLVLLALMIVAMLGIAALVIDLGFVFGQRRFDQNGADAAALAAAQYLARNVSLRDEQSLDGELVFTVNDSDVYELVRKYAGLSKDDLTSNLPTGTNQNPGLSDKNRLQVTLEYAPRPGEWCYSRSSPMPIGPGAVICPETTQVITAHGASIVLKTPPLPVKNHPYRVRVTVSSSTEHFVAQAINAGSSTPQPQMDRNVPVCMPVDLGPGSNGGSTTCASAVAAIKGSTTPLFQGPVLPVTTGSCTITGNSNDPIDLWAPNNTECIHDINPWKNVVDFTDYFDSTDYVDYDGQLWEEYDYTDLMPDDPTSSGCGLDENGAEDCGWDRDDFEADPAIAWPEKPNGDAKHDVPAWIALGFKGKIGYGPEGSKLPTYIGSASGDLGENFSIGFYCKKNATNGTDCDVNPGADTYFFAQHTDYTEYADALARPGQGWRDAGVPIWGDGIGDVDWFEADCEKGKGKEQCWLPFDPDKNSNGPARVRIVGMVTMRLYCEHEGSFCTGRPSRLGTINLPNSNSSVWGRVIAPYSTDCQDSQCNTGVRLEGVTAVLER